MPLNETQRRSLFEVLKLVVDSLADIALSLPSSSSSSSSSSSGTSSSNVVVAAITASIQPVTIDINEAASVLDAHRELYAPLQTGRHSDQINVGEEVRADWQAIDQFIQKKAEYKSVEDCVKRRRATPNFDPICIADMQVYGSQYAMTAAKAVAPAQFTEVLLQLIRLRELFLEMTPMSEHQYDPSLPLVKFRMGSVPLGLDKFGAKPLPGEISSDVGRYVEDRMEQLSAMIDARTKHAEDIAVERRRSRSFKAQIAELQAERVCAKHGFGVEKSQVWCPYPGRFAKRKNKVYAAID